MTKTAQGAAAAKAFCGTAHVAALRRTRARTPTAAASALNPPPLQAGDHRPHGKLEQSQVRHKGGTPHDNDLCSGIQAARASHTHPLRPPRSASSAKRKPLEGHGLTRESN